MRSLSRTTSITCRRLGLFLSSSRFYRNVVSFLHVLEVDVGFVGSACSSTLCHERQLQGLERKAKVEGSQLRLYKAKEGRNEGMREAS